MSIAPIVSELCSGFYIDSGQDLDLDFIKLEPVDFELYHRGEDDDPSGWCMEESSYDESPFFELPDLPSPLNVWLPCPGDDMELESEEKLEDDQEQVTNYDWPRMESDWLVREMRGSDWLKPSGPDWQHQDCINTPFLQNIEEALQAAANTIKLLAKMKPCSVLLDPTVVKLYLSEQNLHLDKKIEKIEPKKKCKKVKPLALPPIPKIKIKLTNNGGCYLEKSNPDFVYPNYIRKNKNHRKPCNEPLKTTKEPSYLCPHCYSQFKTEFEFRFHMSQNLLKSFQKYIIDTEPHIYECINCLKTFENHLEFTKHMNKVHDLCVSCDQCDEQFTFVCQLNKHQYTQLHFISGEVECAKCGIDFPNIHCLDSHNLMWHEFSSHQCQMCGLYFQSASKLNCHNCVQHGTGLFSEFNPQQSSQQNGDVVQVKKECDSYSDNSFDSNKSDTSWPCEICNINFNNVEKFMCHWKTEHVSVPLPKWFSQIIFFANPDIATDVFVSDLDIPKSVDFSKVCIKKENDVSEKNTFSLHHCSKCNKSFKSRVHLLKHTSCVHKFDAFTDRESFGGVLCSYCPSSTENDKLMFVHMVLNHQPFMTYECIQCDIPFLKSNEYMYHFKNCHNSDKMFRCKVCLMTFATSSMLGKHVQNQHGKKLIFCNHCMSDLNIKQFLKKHCAQCIKDNNLICCPFCHMVFVHSPKFKAHILEHAKNFPLLHCEVCLNTFFSKDNLASHLKYIHTKEINTSQIKIIKYERKL